MYVYLIYEECHGLVKICRSEASADREILSLALEIGIDIEKAKLDYNSFEIFGWSECHWERREVYD